MPQPLHAHLVPAPRVAHELTRRIAKATQRVAIVVTTFHNDSVAMHRLVDALCAASLRGVAVSVCVDSYTYTEPKEFLLRAPKRHPTRAYNALKTERTLKRAGVQFHWLGRASNVGFAGRTHTKWIIIDDWVYSFGGVNLDTASFAHTDYLLRSHSQRLADQLFREHQRLLTADRANHATRSRTLIQDAHTRILVDGGLVGDSVIYRRACRLARNATSIIVVSQYCPTGKFNRILKRKRAKLYFNHWRHATWMNKFMIRFGMLSARQRTRYHQRQYLHAKFILFTMPDGREIVLSGSHNFMFSSVMIGTREVALETSEPQIVRQVKQFFLGTIAQ